MPYIAFKRAKSAITQEEGFLISSLRAKKDLTNPVHKSERLWDLCSFSKTIPVVWSESIKNASEKKNSQKFSVMLKKGQSALINAS